MTEAETMARVRRLVAHHEAGHVAVGAYVGFCITCAWMEPIRFNGLDDWRGRTEHCIDFGPLATVAPDGRRHVETLAGWGALARHLAYVMAGGYAGALAIGADPDDALAEFTDVSAAACLACGRLAVPQPLVQGHCDHLDALWLVRHLYPTATGDADARGMLTMVWAGLHDVLARPEVSACAEAVAAELLASGRVEGGRLQALVRGHLCRAA